MKKKLIIISASVIVVIGILIGLYFYGLSPKSKSEETKLFTINSGTSKVTIASNLKEEGLIRSKISLTIYLALHSNLNLQAGTYELSPSMSAKEMMAKIDQGKIKEEKNTYNLTFIEGKRLTTYASQIAKATGTTEEEVLRVLSDKEYLQSLIDEYWFLTSDILSDGIYYPLEGYLFPSTYEFYNNSTIKDIIKVMLDTLDSKLKSYKDAIENSNYSVHGLLTMASVIEQEGASKEDRAGVAGVFYNRLKSGDSLGSDVTTYYAARKDYSNDLTWSEINNCDNGYNTRGACNKGKLPIGPICSPSISSILAAINPDSHDFYFFVADKNKKTYFTKTYNEHINKVKELKSAGLWYEYN